MQSEFKAVLAIAGLWLAIVGSLIGTALYIAGSALGVF